MRQLESPRYRGAGWWTIALLAVTLAGTGTARAQGDKPVATVNNEIIAESEFFMRLQRLHGSDFLVSTNPPQMRTESAGVVVMNSLLSERLIVQLAAKNKQAPTDAEVNAQLEILKKEANVIQALKDRVITEDELKYDIRVDKSHFNLAANGVTITPDEVDAYYKKNIQNYTTPERWSLSAIRTSKLEDVPKIQQELQSGKTFGEVAKLYSEDKRTEDGNIGVFYVDDKNLPEAIRVEVKKLRLGGVTPPVPIDFDTGKPGADKIKMYWLIKLTARDAEKVKTLDSIRPQVERVALLDKVGGYKTADEKILAFRDSSDIKINIPGYEALTKKSK